MWPFRLTILACSNVRHVVGMFWFISHHFEILGAAVVLAKDTYEVGVRVLLDMPVAYHILIMGAARTFEHVLRPCCCLLS